MNLCQDAILKLMAAKEPECAEWLRDLQSLAKRMRKAQQVAQGIRSPENIKRAESLAKEFDTLLDAQIKLF